MNIEKHLETAVKTNHLVLVVFYADWSPHYEWIGPVLRTYEKRTVELIRVNAGLVNILNISDGLLSDELCIKFICTFNAPLKDIDEALLRKGRLAARYEFKDLTTDKVNQLIKEESLDIPEQTHPMTLAEIYNYEGMDFSQGRKRVGF